MTREDDSVSLQMILSGTRPEVLLPLDYGEGMILLTSTLAPQYGFLLAGHSGGGHKWRLAFTGYENVEFRFVCFCCHPETKREGVDRNDMNVVARFRRRLEDLCMANGITTVFARTALAWYDSKRYGPLDGIKLVEAINLYQNDAIQSAFPSVAWQCSKIYEAHMSWMMTGLD